MMAALIANVRICMALNLDWEQRSCLLETNVGVSNQEGAEDGIHDGVEGAGGEGSDAEGDQADADSSVDKLISAHSRKWPGFRVEPLESPVVATLHGVRAGNGDGVVHYQSRLEWGSMAGSSVQFLLAFLQFSTLGNSWRVFIGADARLEQD